MKDYNNVKINDRMIKEVLERHKHWLNKDCKNWECMRANLYNVNLDYTNLNDADLRGAQLIGANLYDSNLRNANLINAYLCDANLIGADLRNVDLQGANLCGANLYGANIANTDMHTANLIGALLDSTNNLRRGVKLGESIIGWKKCKNNVLVKLEIPKGAIVFSINGTKCRTDKAKVLEIVGGDRAYSRYQFFSYYVGDIIEVFDFNCEYNIECAKGIHFFRTREEAEKY